MAKKDNLLTVKEASKKANINQSVLYTVMHYDRLVSEKIGERTFIKEDVLDDWIKKNIKPSVQGGSK